MHVYVHNIFLVIKIVYSFSLKFSNYTHKIAVVKKCWNGFIGKRIKAPPPPGEKPPKILKFLAFYYFPLNNIFQFRCLWISLTVSHTLMIVFFTDYTRGLYSGLGFSKKWPILGIISHKLQSNQLQFN